MSESVVGVSTALTWQNDGSAEYVWPFGAVNDGPGTVTADVMVVSATWSVMRLSQVAASADVATLSGNSNAMTRSVQLPMPIDSELQPPILRSLFIAISYLAVVPHRGA